MIWHAKKKNQMMIILRRNKRKTSGRKKKLMIPVLFHNWNEKWGIALTEHLLCAGNYFKLFIDVSLI